MEKKLKLIKKLHNSELSDKLSKEITYHLKQCILIITDENLIEDKEYSYNGFKLDKIIELNGLKVIQYLFKNGIFICDISKKDNQLNTFTIIFNDEYITEKNMHNKKYNVYLNDDFKFNSANSNYGNLYIEDQNEYNSFITIEVEFQITKKSKKHIIKYYGIERLDIEINNKDNKFFKEFIFVINSIYKSNNKLDFFNKYPTEIELLKHPKKFFILINLFTKQYEKKYNELQNNLDLLRMINI